MSLSIHNSKIIWGFYLRVVVFFISAIIAIELFFTYVFPVDSRPVYYQDEDTKLLFFDRDFRASGIHRYGNPPVRGGEWKVNLAGWASPFEYLVADDREKQLIALYGDSYVVGLNTDYVFHQDYLLKQELDGYDVYNFAMGGMMLMEYVKLIEYAESNYDPCLHIIYLNGGDVRMSLRNFTTYSLYYQLSYADGEFLIIEPVSFYENPLKRIFRNSKLLIYLRYHRGITLFGSGRGRVDPNANADNGDIITSFGSEEERIEEERILEQAARYMIEMIIELTGNDTILFVLDAPRGPIYRKENDIEPFQDCRVVQQVSEDYPNVYCLDLLPVYQSSFEADAQFFNDPDNPHWNDYGNCIVADAIAGYLEELLWDSSH